MESVDSLDSPNLLGVLKDLNRNILRPLLKRYTTREEFDQIDKIFRDYEKIGTRRDVD